MHLSSWFNDIDSFMYPLLKSRLTSQNQKKKSIIIDGFALETLSWYGYITGCQKKFFSDLGRSGTPWCRVLNETMLLS